MHFFITNKIHYAVLPVLALNFQLFLLALNNLKDVGEWVSDFVGYFNTHGKKCKFLYLILINNLTASHKIMI